MTEKAPPGFEPGLAELHWQSAEAKADYHRGLSHGHLYSNGRKTWPDDPPTMLVFRAWFKMG